MTLCFLAEIVIATTIAFCFLPSDVVLFNIIIIIIFQKNKEKL
jgi:hypothetical protein